MDVNTRHRHWLNNRSFIAFAFTLILFGVANLISYYVRSDPLGARDGIHRIGFPFLVSERGGFTFRSEFDHVAFWVNIAIAFSMGTIIRIIVKKVTK